MAIGGFIKGILGADGIIAGATKTLDAVVLTEEERQSAFLQFASSTLPMKRARRLIAVMVTGIWAVYALVALGMVVADHPQTAEVIDLGFKLVMPGFTTVIAFYFWLSSKKEKEQAQ